MAGGRGENYLILFIYFNSTLYLIFFLFTEDLPVLRHRMKIVIGSCTVFFLLGLPMCTTGGLHLFNIFDQRCTSSLLLLCLIEVCNFEIVVKLLKKLLPPFRNFVSVRKDLFFKRIFLPLVFHGSKPAPAHQMARSSIS
jgi:hypothetical protein